MITDDGIDLVARGNAMEELKALASPVHLELQGESTIRDDYDGGIMVHMVQISSAILQYGTTFNDRG